MTCLGLWLHGDHSAEVGAEVTHEPLCANVQQQSSVGPGVAAPAVVRAAVPRAQVWALKSYTKSAPLYVQVLQRSSLGLISPFLDPDRDVIVSVEQTRHRLLALSCLCPGASTLIGAGRSPALCV